MTDSANPSTCVGDDIATIVAWLRSENPAQYQILVNMHLSFTLDQTYFKEQIEEKTSLFFWRKRKTVTNVIPLSNLRGLDNLYIMISFVSEEPRVLTEGIFRLTGSVLRQRELKTRVNTEVVLSNDVLQTYTIHDCASVLKQILSDLDEPLLTNSLCRSYEHVANLHRQTKLRADITRVIKALQLLTLLLPETNRTLLKALLTLLNKIAHSKDVTRMPADNLALIFTPHLLCAKNLSPEDLYASSQNLKMIVCFMINKVDQIFSIPSELGTDILIYMDKIRKENLSIDLDQSICQSIFTFVDKAKTDEANDDEYTKKALTDLYTQIQALPESKSKREFQKNFAKYHRDVVSDVNK